MAKPEFQRKPCSAREKELIEKTARYLPAGVRNPSASPEYAMVVKEAGGSRIRDFSGNEYIDYLMGSGPLLLGHAHPAVVAAVRERLGRGSSYLMVNEPSIELAEKIVAAVPCAEAVCFNSTGSESTLFALRIARAHRGRDKILKFEGGFHGMNDYALMSNQWTRSPRDLPIPTPNSAGIPRCLEDEVLIAPFNDARVASQLIEKHADALAGVIVEPLQRTIPPEPGFLEAVREATRRHGIPLIFDEVVTGFRLAYGGAQEYYGVVPDLCALCKGIASGHPISVLCGRDELMSRVDAARGWPGGHVAQTGTFSGNPLSAAAALATIAELERPGVYPALFAKGRRLMRGLQASLDAVGVPARVTGEPPAFQVWFTRGEIRDFRSTLGADPAMNTRFTELLLDRGIVKAHEKFFLSTAHSDEDIEITLAAFESAAAALAASVQTRT
jgi:glutamate-1-semialdehyde 2,1-aminomutase